MKNLRPYMMPVAMILGAIFYSFFDELAFFTPYIVFVMLFFTHCRLNFQTIKLEQMHIWLIIIQLFGSVIVYMILKPFNIYVAQGAFICVLAPTATAAPVITGILKGNIASVSAYSLLSNLTVSIVAPVIFTLIGNYSHLSFFESFLSILKPVFLLLFSPLAFAFLIQKYASSLAFKIGSYSGVSFYLWTIALCIVTGKTVQFIHNQGSSSYATEVIIALVSLIICVSQFLIGRKIGKLYNNTVAGGQGLGQKNTVLAIWMAQMYLHPIAAIGPGAYVLWQNLVNSYQIWLKRRNL
jgi:BASS family bile acid:Na+ symporter